MVFRVLHTLNLLINFDNQTIILAVIGIVGLLSTATVLVTAFTRNRAHRY